MITQGQNSLTQSDLKSYLSLHMMPHCLTNQGACMASQRMQERGKKRKEGSLNLHVELDHWNETGLASTRKRTKFFLFLETYPND